MNNPDPAPRVSADRLRTFISQAFEKAGVPAGDAGILAELITEADLRGTDTHGVFRLPLYVRHIRLPGVERIWLPGEQSHNKRIERLMRGISIPPTLQKSLDELASELNISAILG
jgi:LDH2 family malate/lactate/ureidoglycolate dehydrogenase